MEGIGKYDQDSENGSDCRSGTCQFEIATGFHCIIPLLILHAQLVATSVTAVFGGSVLSDANTLLFRQEIIEQLLSNIFHKEKNESAIVSAIQILLTLLETRRQT